MSYNKIVIKYKCNVKPKDGVFYWLKRLAGS